MVGQSIDNYSIEELLGQGGMGSVYRALDVNLDRTVALKIMNPGLASNTDFLRRFKSEARVLGRLQHPHIVNIYAFRHVGSHLIIIMEYVSGGTLNDLIEVNGPLKVPKAITLLRQSLQALDFAHSSNIIHRDIKPPNILLTKEHRIKISDFGLAKIQEDTNTTMVTRMGITGGTLYYMPPEQTEELSKVDHRGDLYSLGMTFYQMLAGRVPFDKKSSAFSILRTIDQQLVPPPNTFNPDIPSDLVEVVMKAINKYPDDRYQSAREMLAAINQFSETGSKKDEDVAKTKIFSGPKTIHETLRIDPAARRKALRGEEAQAGRYQAPAARSHGGHEPPNRQNVRPRAESPARVTIRRKESGRKPFVFITVAVILVAVLYGSYVLFRPADDPDRLASQPGSTTPAQTQNTSPPGSSQPNTTPQGAQADAEASGEQPRTNGAVSTQDEPPGADNPSTAEPNTAPNTAPADPPGVGDNTAVVPASQGKTFFVRSNPSGADVYFDGELMGQTPYEIENVSPESHTIRLALDGYQPRELEVDVGRQDLVSIELSPLPGSIRAVVRPFGDIYINGIRKARQAIQPYVEEMRPGEYNIRAVHPALGRWEKNVIVEPGRETEILFQFDQEFTVTVTSQPLNAEILVDGESTGLYTPRQLRLRPGNHTISVRKEGFELVTDPIEILLENDILEPMNFDLQGR